MNLRTVVIILVALVVLANIITLNALPDVIAGLNLVVIIAVLAGVAYFYWRGKQKKDK